MLITIYYFQVNKRTGKKYRNYTQEMLTMAFNDVKSGKHCVSKAAKIYGVPDETLRDKIKGRRKVDCTQKRSLYFSDEEENNILETFEMYGKNGYQYKCVDVIRIASRFVSDCRKSTGFSGGMETNNSECDYESRMGEKVLKRRRRRGKLTRKWFDGFYQRWSQRLAPYIVGANKSEKKSENLGLSANNLAEFFQRYEQILSELNLVDKPSSILLVEDIKLLYPVLGRNDEQIQKSVTIAAVTDLTGCTFPLYFIKEETESDAEKYFEEVNDVSVDTDNLSVLDHILKCFCASNETEDRILIMNGDQLFVHIGIEEWAAKHNIVLLIIPENVAIYLRPFNITAEGRFQETVNQSLISSDLSVSENYHSYKTHVEHQFSITFTEEKMIDCFKKIGLYPADVNAAKTAFLEKSMPVKVRLTDTVKPV